MARGMKRYRRRKQSSGGLKHNPPLFTDLWEFIGPGFGGFAATRFVTRVATTQIGKRWPKAGKHAGAIASVGSFFGAWYFAHKVKFLERFHTPIVVGAGLAAIQSLIQLYIPRLGWIVSDASPELASAQEAKQQQVAAPADDLELVDEQDGWYVYNDAHDAGRYATTPNKASPPPPRPQQGPTPQQAAASSPGSDEDIFDILEEDQMQGAGIFSQN